MSEEVGGSTPPDPPTTHPRTRLSGCEDFHFALFPRCARCPSPAEFEESFHRAQAQSPVSVLNEPSLRQTPGWFKLTYASKTNLNEKQGGGGVGARWAAQRSDEQQHGKGDHQRRLTR